jgi:hypothetical protein
MTNTRPFRNFFGLAVCTNLSLALAGCSGSDVTPDAGSSGNAGSGNLAGSSNSGGSGSTAGTSTGSDEIVGTFQVQVLADESGPTTGMTKIVGQVGDGPVPPNVHWTVIKEDGGCRLETPTAPFCEAGCGSGVCVADEVCQPYPTGHSVGAVTLTGVKLAAGGSELTLKEIAKAYQPPAGTALAYPPFAAGDEIALQATGGDYAAFALSTKGVNPLAFTSTDFELAEGKPLTLTWDAAPDPKSSQMYVKLDISHHGGIKGLIECDVDDSGSLTISSEMITELMGLGVAGFPSVVLMRQSIDTAQIAPGRVRLEVSARAEHYVTIEGVASCFADEECPDGQTCRTTDATCH